MNPVSPIVALATDYDETLAAKGKTAPPTLEALKRLKTSGRKLILVTGRELDDLLQIFHEIKIFDGVVAENGAVLYFPANGKVKSMAPAPPAQLLQLLRQHGVRPLSAGRSIVATLHDQDQAVREIIAEMGLPMEVIFNRDSLMILPAGTNKGTGLEAMLEELHLPAAGVAGIGDAENDEPFLALCGISAAVSNALPAIKDAVDIVTTGQYGAGVIELIDRILAGRREDQQVAGDREQIFDF